jgi:AcrR family transcriptional regulator
MPWKPPWPRARRRLAIERPVDVATLRSVTRDGVPSVAPRPARVRLRHEQRQQQLTDACAYLIATKGYSNTSVREIASHVGISTGTLLHHFASKEELLIATLLAISDDFFEDMNATAEVDADPVTRLRAVVRAILEPPRHDVGWRVWIAFWHEASTNRELALVASQRTDLSEAFLANLIERGRTDGLLRVPDAAVSAAELGALIDGVALRIYGESGRWTPDRAIGLVDRLIDDWVLA